MKKKFASLLMAAVMTMSLALPAFATESAPKYSIKLESSSSTVSMVGNTYNAYRIFDLKMNTETATENTAYDYTVAPEFAGLAAKFMNTTTNQPMTNEELVAYVGELASNSDELNAFAEKVFDFIKEKDISPTNSVEVTEENKDNVVIPVNNIGYYLVSGEVTANEGAEGKKQVIAACSLNTVAPTQTITIKADAPTIDKNILEGENETPTKVNNAAIGDTVKFEIKSVVPKMIGYEKYYFMVTDTLSKGLTFDATKGFTITVGNKILVEDTDYVYIKTDVKETINGEEVDTGKDQIEIVFKDFLIKYSEQAGAEIKITYEATLNSDAVIGVEGNPNDVKLTYSNDPNETSNGTPGNPDKPEPNAPVGETPNKTTRTYVTGLVINKTGKNNQPLAGAEFTLSGEALNKVLVTDEEFVPVTADDDATVTVYYKLADGTYTKTAPTIANDTTDNQAKYDQDEKNTDGSYKQFKLVKRERVEVTTEHISVKAVSGADGVIKFEGLKAGTYKIEETIVPEGYNKAEDITLEIEWVRPESADDPCAWKIGAESSDNANFDKDATTGYVTGGIYTTTIQNQSGTQMPSTGGIGTTIFYTLGGLMVAGAGVLLVTKRRMSK